MSALMRVFRHVGHALPSALANWEEQVATWNDAYRAMFPIAQLSDIHIDFAVFEFDELNERVTLAYSLSVEQLMKRDSNRMRGFVNVNELVRKIMGGKAFVADKGHFLGHASGGVLDINLFPQRRELNRGWSPEGKRFRQMERYVEEHPITFFYHRPLYNDDSWIPHYLEYGILVESTTWWVEVFQNK